MAGFDDEHGADFDEQIGLEDECLDYFDPDEFAECGPPDEEPIAPVVLPEIEGLDAHEKKTAEGTALSESPSPLAKRVAAEEASESSPDLERSLPPGGSPLKRRKMEGKTSPDQYPWRSNLKAACGEGAKEEEEPEWWSKLDQRQKYMWAYNRTARVAFVEYKLHLAKITPGEPLPFAMEFGKTHSSDKAMVLDWWL